MRLIHHLVVNRGKNNFVCTDFRDASRVATFFGELRRRVPGHSVRGYPVQAEVGVHHFLIFKRLK
jgi:hypothetical protein